MKQYNEYEDMTLLLSEIKKNKVLDADTQRALVRQAQQGDDTARDTLVSSNMRFVMAFASKYTKSNISIQELISEGNLGLLDAINKYDPNKNSSFISYAALWVRHYIERLTHQSSRSVRIPMNKVRLSQQLKQEEEILFREGIMNDAERIEMLSERMNVSVEAVGEIQSYAKENLSLNKKIKSEEVENMEYIDKLEDTNTIPVDMQVEHENNRELLAVLIKTIPKREGSILRERYGLQGKVKSLSELSKKLGISKERVRQLEMRGIERLKAKYAHLEQSHGRQSSIQPSIQSSTVA